MTKGSKDWENQFKRKKKKKKNAQKKNLQTGKDGGKWKITEAHTLKDRKRERVRATFILGKENRYAKKQDKKKTDFF